ncbi:MAG: iron ABC transporter permease [Candidatus Omnitrophica bacterium]|nr:iron ABC transporter permease [Candidatus Omnitrophota bacterium]
MGNAARRFNRTAVVLSLSLAALGAAAAAALTHGATALSWPQIVQILGGDDGSAAYSIFMRVRLPRVLLGCAVGGALSVAGVILQGLFRNPLVEPYTLGISGGAALGVCVCLALGLQHLWQGLAISLAAFAGALLVLGILFLISAVRQMRSLNSLLLFGVMLSFICSSGVMFLMAVMRLEDLQGIVFWTMGSLEQPNHVLIAAALCIAALGLAAGLWFARDLNAFSLGENAAAHLGIPVGQVKAVLLVVASLLTGCCVSVAGVIGFIGLTIPHLVRRVVGADHRALVPGAFLAGAAFLIGCDTLARTLIAPLELPVGVLTGLIGGFVFLSVLCRRQEAR